MTCRFIFKSQFLIIQYSILAKRNFILNSHFLSDIFQFLVVCMFIYNYYCIINIPSLYKSEIDKLFNFTQETECSSWCKLIHKFFFKVKKSRVLELGRAHV